MLLMLVLLLLPFLCGTIFNKKGGINMNMIPVFSSNISSIGYESNTLYVKFTTGSLYSYSGVPMYVYQELMNAPSHGKYFATYIKNDYPCRRL